MRRRGNDHVQVWHGEGVTLAVSRYEWELHSDFSDNILLLVEPDLVVAADASIIYRDDLRRRLRDHATAVGPSASHLIAAAYRAFGDRCTRILEGEFSFILWDRIRRRALISRDFLGKRPLHYSERPRACIVASTIGGVVAHRDVPDDFNLPSIAATAAGMHAAGPETCFRAVTALPAGCDLLWTEGSLLGPTRHWEPVIKTDSLPFAEASEELRVLLQDATRERLASSGVTSVWMSGGWDSPAVFGAGQDVLRKVPPGNRRLVPVSISYPEGDPGREDDLIKAIADHWDASVCWLDIGDFSLFPPKDLQRRRDEPYQHLYEEWNRSLARGSRSVGSRVALDGNGGDQVFQVSEVYLADLFASGKWVELQRDWAHRGDRGFRPFFRTAIQPVLPQVLLDTATVLRGGRRLNHYIERWTPNWFLPEFLNQSKLAERDRQYLPQPTGSRADAETAWYWTSAFFHRAFAHLTSFALVEGVELRSPLADRRVVEFGLRRPREERASGLETKRLLRSAVKGLLPDHVLAPRRWRTGTTNGFSHREMSRRFPALLQELQREPMELERLGIIDPGQLSSAARTYRRLDQAALRVALYYTYHTEQWLRSWRQSSEHIAPEPVRSRESFTDLVACGAYTCGDSITGRAGPVPEKERIGCTASQP